MESIGEEKPAMRSYGNRNKETSIVPGTYVHLVAPGEANGADATSQSAEKSVLGKRGPNEIDQDVGSKKLKVATIGSPLTRRDVVKGSFPYLQSDLSDNEALISTADFPRFLTGRKKSSLVKERDSALKLADERAKKIQELEKNLEKKDSASKSLRKHGPLPPKYTRLLVTRMMRTTAYEQMFVDLPNKARILGQSEGLKMYVSWNPELEKYGLPSVQDLDEAITVDKAALKSGFVETLQDDGFKCPFLDHLKDMPYLPDMKGLKALDVDFNKGLPTEMQPSSL